jgi:hypothetical protein
MRFIISLSILLIAFDSTKIRRIKQALDPCSHRFKVASQTNRFKNSFIIHNALNYSS